MLPADIPHPPNRLFYKQEILLSSLENTNDAAQISGKCAILEHSDYTSSKCRFPASKGSELRFELAKNAKN